MKLNVRYWVTTIHAPKRVMGYELIAYTAPPQFGVLLFQEKTFLI